MQTLHILPWFTNAKFIFPFTQQSICQIINTAQGESTLINKCRLNQVINCIMTCSKARTIVTNPIKKIKLCILVLHR